ncbi:MAG: hypothetical protein ACR2FU_21130 [Streptosporangiaceae bacterium]
MLRFVTARTAARTAAALALPAAAVLGLTGCATASTTCVIRHHLAIVVFQNGVGNYGNRAITRFRLTLRYGPHSADSRLIYPHLALHAAHGGNPPVVVRTYRAGPATGCHAGHIRARQ